MVGETTIRIYEYLGAVGLTCSYPKSRLLSVHLFLGQPKEVSTGFLLLKQQSQIKKSRSFQPSSLTLMDRQRHEKFAFTITRN